MTMTEYWTNELAQVSELALAADTPDDSQIVAALLVARQLQAIVTSLSQLDTRLAAIEVSLE